MRRPAVAEAKFGKFRPNPLRRIADCMKKRPGGRFAIIHDSRAKSTVYVAHYRAGTYCPRSDRTGSGYSTNEHARLTFLVPGRRGAAGLMRRQQWRLRQKPPADTTTHRYGDDSRGDDADNPGDRSSGRVDCADGPGNGAAVGDDRALAPHCR